MGIAGRTETLVAIGIAVSVGMTLGALGQLWAIRLSLGKVATAGMLRGAVVVAVASAVVGAGAYWLVNAVLAWLGTGVGGAFAAAIVGGVVIVTGGGAAIFVADRRAIAMTGRGI